MGPLIINSHGIRPASCPRRKLCKWWKLSFLSAADGQRGRRKVASSRIVLLSYNKDDDGHDDAPSRTRPPTVAICPTISFSFFLDYYDFLKYIYILDAYRPVGQSMSWWRAFGLERNLTSISTRGWWFITDTHSQNLKGINNFGYIPFTWHHRHVTLQIADDWRMEKSTRIDQGWEMSHDPTGRSDTYLSLLTTKCCCLFSSAHSLSREENRIPFLNGRFHIYWYKSNCYIYTEFISFLSRKENVAWLDACVLCLYIPLCHFGVGLSGRDSSQHGFIIGKWLHLSRWICGLYLMMTHDSDPDVGWHFHATLCKSWKKIAIVWGGRVKS